jgi:hypothetical protein
VGLAQQGFGGNVLGRANAAAGTAYYAVVPGKTGCYTSIAQFAVRCGNTANDVYWLRPLGRANVTVAATTSDASLTLDADPSPTGNTIAAGDQVVIQHSDGTNRRAQVNTSGWNGTTKVVTFTADLAANVAVGAKIWNFGVHTDTDPVLGTAHPVFGTTANATVTPVFDASGIRGHQTGDPLLFYTGNATNATDLLYAEYARTIE